MQGHSERGTERRQFRSMALDMANRYLPLVQSLKTAMRISQRCCLVSPYTFTGRLTELTSQIEREQAKLGITPARRREIETIVSEHLSGSQSYDKRAEVHLSMVRILMHRYANRVQHMTPSLFEDFDPDPKSPLKADSGVSEAARFHLSDNWKRAYHYGISDLCDASNENAELFLQFAGALVARMETRVIRGKNPGLNAAAQENVLVEKARSIMDGWSFAFARRVRLLSTQLQENALKYRAHRTLG